MANAKTSSVETAKSVAAKKVEETKAAVKTAAKAVEAKAEEVKAEVKAEAAKAEEKIAATIVKAEAPAKKEETAPVKEEKAAEKKKPGRKPGSKTKPAKAAKKEEAVAEIYVQYGPGESSVQNVVEKIKAEYVEQGHRASSIKSLKVYLKPEDRSAYYVINDKVAGRVDLF